MTQTLNDNHIYLDGDSYLDGNANIYTSKKRKILFSKIGYIQIRPYIVLYTSQI